jgi:hypothetical protein
MRGQFLSLAAVAFGFLSLACEPGGVGDPCTPEDEYVQTFSGYKETEVNVESRSFQCETRVCLVNHFRGRVSCPYGQSSTDTPTFDPNTGQQVSGLPPTDPHVCRIPGTSGQLATDAIVVPVPPQLYSRTATATADRTGQGKVEDAVYCSCRCANADGNTDDGARYCECPSGFVCRKLIDDVGLGSSELAGSYCIREGTDFAQDDIGESCAGTNCGNNGNNP